MLDDNQNGLINPWLDARLETHVEEAIAYSSASGAATPSWTFERPGSVNTLCSAADTVQPRSPRLLQISSPPSTARGTRRADPLRIPEAVGLVLPSWLPYTTPPSTPAKPSTPSKQVLQTQWSPRHHLCESSANSRLPRLQRVYFDDLPNTRCQGGAYTMVPGHRSKNFDSFCSAPAHVQNQGLQQRFERYPFVEACREMSLQISTEEDLHCAIQMAQAPSSSSSCSSLGDASEGLESQPRTPLASTSRTSDKAWASNTTAHHSGEKLSLSSGVSDNNRLRTSWENMLQRQVSRMNDRKSAASNNALLVSQHRASIASKAPTGERCSCGTYFPEDGQVCKRCGKKRASKEAQDEGKTQPLLASPGRASSSGNNAPKSRKGFGNMSRYSVLNKGGLPQFHMWCASKFGNLTRLWRCLDVHSNMRIGQGQFLRGLQDLGYGGDVRELFKSLNRDQTGTLLFYHFAPEVALAVADLLQWARTNHGGLAGIGLNSEIEKMSFLTREQFCNMCKKRGYTREESLQRTFDLIDKDGDGSVSRTEFLNLDKWEFPEWLLAKPDMQAADLFRNRILHRFHGNALLAWRYLNRGGSMRVSWNDFRVACRKFFSAEDQQALPSAWRALDLDLSGWLSLREFDPDAFQKLMDFTRWTCATFGSTMAAFPKLLSNTNGQITQSEFRYTCKPSGLGDDIVNFIFTGLDVDGTGTIEATEIRFLDQWKGLADLKEEDAWAQVAGISTARKKILKQMSMTRQQSRRATVDPPSPRRQSSKGDQFNSPRRSVRLSVHAAGETSASPRHLSPKERLSPDSPKRQSFCGRRPCNSASESHSPRRGSAKW